MPLQIVLVEIRGGGLLGLNRLPELRAHLPRERHQRNSFKSASVSTAISSMSDEPNLPIRDNDVHAVAQPLDFGWARTVPIEFLDSNECLRLQ
jgi:hypothetical protein